MMASLPRTSELALIQLKNSLEHHPTLVILVMRRSQAVYPSFRILDGCNLRALATKCKNCGTGAATRYVDSIGAPGYQRGDATSAVNCSKDCQEAHWQDHKTHCKSMQKRKKLLKVLKATLLTFREATYDIDLTKVAFDNGVLCLDQNRRSDAAQAKRRSLPSHLTANAEYKEAAHAHNSCTTARRYWAA